MGIERRPDGAFLFTVFVVVLGALCGLMLVWGNLWSGLTDPRGISRISVKPPTWDFTNLWYGTRLALDGEAHVLFDPEAYRAGLRSLFGPHIYDSEWSYPPQTLLLGIPLANLPVLLAYAIWTLGTMGLLVFAARRMWLPKSACLLLLVSPGVLVNSMFGQNGALTTSLLMLGLYSAVGRPALGGGLFAVLTFKPQFGLLVPFALAASGRWAAFGWTIVFAAAVGVMTTWMFGTEVWIGFLEVTRPLMQDIMQAPYGQPYHANAVTAFALARALGADLSAAYAIQAAFAAGAVCATLWLWRRPGVDLSLRCAATGPLVLLATPYSWSYDMVVTTFTAAVLFVRHGHRLGLVTGLAWLWPVFTGPITSAALPLGPVVLLALAWVALREVAGSEAANDGSETPSSRDAIPVGRTVGQN